jgi:hypothetical protein
MGAEAFLVDLAVLERRDEGRHRTPEGGGHGGSPEGVRADTMGQPGERSVTKPCEARNVKVEWRETG